MSANVRHSCESVQQFSPGWMTRDARYTLSGDEDLGPDLDPASCALANDGVQATYFFDGSDSTRDGLIIPWIPRILDLACQVREPEPWPFAKPCTVFHNPPTPAAVWWAKACHELQCDRVSACVFVAFSVELFQTAQNAEPHTPDSRLWQPFEFAVCIPRCRVAYDQPIDDRIAALKKLHQKAMTLTGPKAATRERALATKIGKVLALKKDGARIVTADSPPHSSAVILMMKPPRKREEHARVKRFLERFRVHGYVHIPATWEAQHRMWENPANVPYLGGAP